MKKRLLLQFLVLLCVAAVQAQGYGYLYSASTRYKLLSDTNFFPNGDFSAYYDKWTNELGGDVSSAWALNSDQQIEGQSVTAITSTGATTEEGTVLQQVIELAPGEYTLSYWAKAAEAFTTSLVEANGQNVVTFYTSQTGEVGADSIRYAGETPVSTEWKQVVNSVTVDEDHPYLVFKMKNMLSGTFFAKFELRNVQEVFDDRIALRQIAYAESLLALEGFKDTEGDESLTGQIEFIKLALEDPQSAEDAELMNDLLNSYLAPAIKTFLDNNAGNLIGTTEQGNKTERYLYDWNNIGSYNWNNMTVQKTWSFDGGRWGFAPNVDPTYDDDGNINNTPYLERAFSEGPVASAGVQRNYQLNVGMHIVDSTFVGTSLQPGRYMFSIEAQAVAAQYSSNSDIAAHGYGSNETVEIRGPWMWVGNDTVTFNDVVLNGRNWQRIYHIAEITSQGDITAGMHFPVVEGTTGGRYSLRNPEFRYVGKNQAEVDHLFAHDQIVDNRAVLKGYIDLARDQDNPKTKEDGYPWGHKVLEDSIAKFQAIYDATFSVIDADGNEVAPDEVTYEYKDFIIQAANFMKAARTNYANTNKVYQQLVSDIAYCRETNDAEAYANCDHATFLAVINKAQGMVDATQKDADEVDQFKEMDDELLTARQDFMMPSASRANPVDLNYTFRNGGFEDFGTGKVNITSERLDYNHWNFYTGRDFKQWQVYPNDAYESGMNCNQWRGTTAGINGKVNQVFKLKNAGVYEFRSKAYACDDTWSQYEGIAECRGELDLGTMLSKSIADTVYKPMIKLFFGLYKSQGDSLALFKCAPQVLNYTRYTPLTYSIIYVKKDDVEEEFELGLEAYLNCGPYDGSNNPGDRAGANAFGFGDNHLYFLGPEAAYKTATQADYDAECANARSVMAKYNWEEIEVGNDDGTHRLSRYFYNAMYRYMGDAANYPNPNDYVIKPAETLQDQQNAIHSLKEVEEWLEAIATYVPEEEDPNGTSINAVTNGQPLNAASGIYTLTGVRVQNGKNLPRGLYIINGKKYVVK